MRLTGFKAGLPVLKQVQGLKSGRNIYNIPFCVGHTHKCASENAEVLESLVEYYIEMAEKCADEQDERTRRMDLEMEERMREREERRDMQMFSMFHAVMQQLCGSTPTSHFLDHNIHTSHTPHPHPLPYTTHIHPNTY